jgi:ribulose 1,5-bisphosphate synthetase/thiazole synthase
VPIVKEFGIRAEAFDDGHNTVDSVESTASLLSTLVHAGATAVQL